MAVSISRRKALMGLALAGVELMAACSSPTPASKSLNERSSPEAQVKRTPVEGNKNVAPKIALPPRLAAPEDRNRRMPSGIIISTNTDNYNGLISLKVPISLMDNLRLIEEEEERLTPSLPFGYSFRIEGVALNSVFRLVDVTSNTPTSVGYLIPDYDGQKQGASIFDFSVRYQNRKLIPAVDVSKV